MAPTSTAPTGRMKEMFYRLPYRMSRLDNTINLGWPSADSYTAHLSVTGSFIWYLYP